MLLTVKTVGSFFFRVKKAYLIITQLEKMTVKKAQAKVVKCAENKCWVPRKPHWSLKRLEDMFQRISWYSIDCSSLENSFYTRLLFDN